MSVLDVEAGIYSRLVNDPEVAKLAADRVYAGLAPQHADLPYAVVSDRVSTTRLWDMGGPSGLASARVQVDIYAAGRSSAKALAFRVRENLDGYSGPLGGEVAQLVQLIDQGENVEPPDDAGERGTFRIRFDFLVHANETRPNR